MSILSKYGLILFLIIISLKSLTAQEGLDNYTFIQETIESIANTTEDNITESDLLEHFIDLINNPVNINNASRNELEKLYFLNEFQIVTLLDHLQRYGSIASIYELSYIPGYSIQLIKKITPFIQITDTKDKEPIYLHSILKYNQQEFLLRTQQILEDQKGYIISDSAPVSNSNFLGPKQKILSKYKFEYFDHIKLGFTLENDAGEELLKGSNQNKFDFQSGHLQLKEFGHLKTLVIGDFQTEFGQGLIAWSNMNMGKTTQVLNLRKRARGIRKYSSTDENNFMRGIGLTIQLKNIHTTAFYSQKKVDANLVQDSISQKLYFSSLINTGYHRTLSELGDKHVLNQQIFGGQVKLEKTNFQIAASFIQSLLNHEHKPYVDLYKRFKTIPNPNSNISVDYQIYFNKLTLFGEEAWQANNGFAFLNGGNLFICDVFSFAFLHRHYDRNFYTVKGDAFGANSNINNEEGLYVGVETKLFKYLNLKAYYDFYSFHWLNYNTLSPSQGNDFLICLDYASNQSISSNIQLKKKQAIKSISNTQNTIPENSRYELTKLRFDLNITHNTFKNRFRIEYSNYTSENSQAENGLLLFYEMSYKMIRIPVDFNIRYSLFETDSYNTRIYSYERDVLYAFSIPALYGNGSRYYLNIHYKFRNVFEIWLKLSQTAMRNQETILSGFSEISGNTKTDLALQIRFKF